MVCPGQVAKFEVGSVLFMFMFNNLIQIFKFRNLTQEFDLGIWNAYEFKIERTRNATSAGAVGTHLMTISGTFATPHTLAS